MRIWYGRGNIKLQVFASINQNSHNMGKRQAIHKYLSENGKGKEPKERRIRQSLFHDSGNEPIPLTSVLAAKHFGYPKEQNIV